MCVSARVVSSASLPAPPRSIASARSATSPPPDAAAVSPRRPFLRGARPPAPLPHRAAPRRRRRTPTLPPPRARRDGAAPSRPSFRPRPIDVHKPLPIIKTSKDLRHEDDVVVNRALPAIASGVDPAEEQERHLRAALLASVYGHADAAHVDIPVPVFRTVEPPPVPARFAPPPAYILYDRADHDLVHDAVEYDADYVDDAFVRDLANPALSVAALERAMDALEKLQAAVDGPALLAYGPARHALADVLAHAPDALRRDVHAHWAARRAARPAPFIRLFQPAPDPANNDPAVAFRPRERDASSGVARRMNTYDNYNKALVLRAELLQLARILAAVVDREALKARVLAVRLLAQRVAAAADGGARMEAANRAVFSGDSEPVVVYGAAPPAHPGVVVPVRGIVVPHSVPVETRKMVGEKAVKKTRRKPRPPDKKKDAPPERPMPPGVDGFGFDEHGNKFLKHMRYFAGGFMNYGVSPYDHRVFAAASERNTVRALPREPDPFTFPAPPARWGGRPAPRPAPAAPPLVARNHVVADILGEKRAAELRDQPSPAKLRGTVRVRGRVGRGGRIMLDRVVFERERGVKAASYPASVEMGGVYTGGLPLNDATRAAAHAPVGNMGHVAMLADFDADADVARRARRLVPPLEPMFPVRPDGDYWPRRHGGKDTRLFSRKNAEGDGDGDNDGDNDSGDETDGFADVVTGDDMRRLPAFAPRNEPLVSEV